MTITKFDRDTIRLIRKDIDKALEPIKEKYGLDSLDSGNATFNSNEFTMKIEGLLSKDSEAEENQARWNMYADAFKIPMNGVGKQFEHKGNMFEIISLTPRSSKFPIHAKRLSDGKMFGFPTTVTANLKP